MSGLSGRDQVQQVSEETGGTDRKTENMKQEHRGQVVFLFVYYFHSYEPVIWVLEGGSGVALCKTYCQ